MVKNPVLSRDHAQVAAYDAKLLIGGAQAPIEEDSYGFLFAAYRAGGLGFVIRSPRAFVRSMKGN